MAIVIADTDVLIDYLKGAGACDKVFKYIASSQLSTTAISSFELWVGAHTKREKSAVESLLASIPILDVSEAAAKKAAMIHQALLKSGETIGMADSLIAGVCHEVNAALLTNNVKHFSLVDNLRLI